VAAEPRRCWTGCSCGREIDDLQALVPALVAAAVVGHAGGDLEIARAAVDELDRVVRG
jgi:hypothetical protein